MRISHQVILQRLVSKDPCHWFLYYEVSLSHTPTLCKLEVGNQEVSYLGALFTPWKLGIWGYSDSMAQLPSQQAPPLSPPQSFLMPPEEEGILTLYTLAGTNEQAIIDVLTKRSNVQRQQIAKSFKAQFGKVSEKGVEDWAAPPGMDTYAQETLH